MCNIWNVVNAQQILLISRNSLLTGLEHYAKYVDTEVRSSEDNTKHQAHLRSSDFSWDTLRDFYQFFILFVWSFRKAEGYLLQLLTLG